MKKFGTPIGAGPGKDSENVGLDVAGTPRPLGNLALADVVLVFVVRLCGFVGLGEDWPWMEDLSGADELGSGGALDELVVVGVPGVPDTEGEVEVELEVEVENEVVDDGELGDVEDEVVVEELVVSGEVLVVVVVVVVSGEVLVVVVVVVSGEVLVVVVVVVDDDELAGPTQIIVSSTAPGTSRVGMTPGVASTGTVVAPPPTSVTVTVQGSAKASGTTAKPTTRKMTVASENAARSLRLNVNLVFSCDTWVRLSSVEIRCNSRGPDFDATGWSGALQFRTGGFTSTSQQSLARGFNSGRPHDRVAA